MKLYHASNTEYMPDPAAKGSIANPDFPFRDVIVLTQYYAPEPGAPQIRLRAMVKELRRMGVNVRVITGMPNYPVGEVFEDYRGKLTMEEEIDGVPVRRTWLYAAAGRGSAKRLINYLSFSATGLLALLRERKADLIFVEAQPITLALAAWLIKMLRRVPYIYNTPDLQVEHAEEAGWLSSSLLIDAARNLEAFLMREALSVTTVTHAFIEHFIRERGISPLKMSFLPNGADTDVLKPLPRDPAYAAKMGVGDRMVFTFAGTHAPYQGLEVIVDAAARLRERDDIVIVMVGKGPVRSVLMEKAREKELKNIIFGESPFDEMHQLMSITYASLVTLRDQPTAKKMRLSKTIPPLACGVPVIFAGNSESAQILEREGAGIQVAPEDAEQLAGAIAWLADNPERRNTMSEKARAIAERDFSWRALVRDWARQIGAIAQGESPEIPGFRT